MSVLIDKNDYTDTLNRWGRKADGTSVSAREKEPVISNRAAGLSSTADNRLWLDVINEIVLWKIDRSVSLDQNPDVLSDLINIVADKNFNPDWKDYENKDTIAIRNLIEKLIEVQGIELPMASTILHFLCPDKFLIIDQRAHRFVFGVNDSRDTIKERYDELRTSDGIKSKAKRISQIYCEYMAECREIYDNSSLSATEFKEFDKYTYQKDIEDGNKIVK